MTTRLTHDKPLREQLMSHQAFVGRLARTLVSDTGGAEDLAQEAWLVALQRTPHTTIDMRAWLAGLLRRLASNRRRGEARRRVREQVAARPEAVEVCTPLIEQQKVVGAVLSLESSLREVVVLAYFEDLTPKQIAKRLGIPSATVRTRLHRARGRLRDRLDELHGGDGQAWISGLLPLLVSPVDGTGFPFLSKATISGHRLMSANILLPTIGALTVIGSATIWWTSNRNEAQAPKANPLQQVSASGRTPMKTDSLPVAITSTSRSPEGLESLPAEQDLDSEHHAYWSAVRGARNAAIRYEEPLGDLRQQVAQAKIASFNVSQGASLSEVIEALQLLSAIPISLSPSARDRVIDEGITFQLQLQHPHRLVTILDIVTGLAGPTVSWHVGAETVRIGFTSEANPDMIEFAHSIADLQIDPDKYFPEHQDISPIFRDVPTTETLVAHAQQVARPASLELEGARIQGGIGVLNVRHLPEVHLAIQRELDRLRRFRCPLPDEGDPGDAGDTLLSLRDQKLTQLILEQPLSSILSPQVQDIEILDLLTFAAQQYAFDLIVTERAASEIKLKSLLLNTSGRAQTITTIIDEPDHEGSIAEPVQWNVIDNCLLLHRPDERLTDYFRASFDVRDLPDPESAEEFVRELGEFNWDLDPETSCRWSEEGVLEVTHSPSVVRRFRKLLQQFRADSAGPR